MKELLLTYSFRANMEEEPLVLTPLFPAPLRDTALQCIKAFTCLTN